MEGHRNGWPGVNRFGLWLVLLGLLNVISGTLLSQSTSEMKMAKQAEFELVDKELNTQYRRVLSGQDGQGKTKLEAAQAAWLKFRDAEAEFAAYSEHQGTAAGLAYIQNQIEQTKLRVEQLKGF
jgi:uncharacterized protein YecT (DUF1311 family)